MPDLVLKQTIVDTLAYDPEIDAEDIGVSVNGGIATLTGHVPTYAQKRAIEARVRGIEGVMGIAMEIEVRRPGTNLTADDEIARHAMDAIYDDMDLPKGAVHVSVTRGWVTLYGNLHRATERDRVAELVRHIAGVHGVKNEIDLAVQE